MRKIILSLLLVMLSSFAAYSAEGVSLSIKFYDKVIYYLSSEPILVQVTLSNNGVLPYRFRISDDRIFSIDFDVKTMQNRAVPISDGLLRKRTSRQLVYFRDVTVEAGESFSFVEDLQHYVSLTSAGSYIVEAKFYPETYKNISDAKVDALSSNRLQLGIRPETIRDEAGVPVAFDVETRANLVREKLPPDEVVEWTLTARQKSQWEKFFLYLDLEALLTRDAARERQWRAQSEAGRAAMVGRYRGDLMEQVVDGDISVLPSSFTIEHTAYNGGAAEVRVLEKFSQVGSFTELRRYTYYLKRTNVSWSIVDWTVMNLGTE